MADAARHYDDLLAEHYTWMLGVPFAEKVARERALLERMGALDIPRGLAIDLGCGPGFHSVALASIGFRPVLAMDVSRKMLEQVSSNADGLSVTPIQRDIRHFRAVVRRGEAAAIVCMGDTLTHLEKPADLTNLLVDAAQALRSGGLLVVSYRDLSAELKGVGRFIPVASDDERILTCMLDFEPQTVVVTDLLHRRTSAGWELRKSSYRKLRLPVSELKRELVDAGFELTDEEEANRLKVIAARRT